MLLVPLDAIATFYPFQQVRCSLRLSSEIFLHLRGRLGLFLTISRKNEVYPRGLRSML